jgi:prepilin-type N-terminal cleavage/methylation domain-containing protein
MIIFKRNKGFTMAEILIAMIVFSLGVAAIHMMLSTQIVSADRDYLEALNIASYLLERERGKVYGDIESTADYPESFQRFQKDSGYIRIPESMRFIYKIDVHPQLANDYNLGDYAIDDLTGYSNPNIPGDKRKSLHYPFFEVPVNIGKVIHIEVKWIPLRLYAKNPGMVFKIKSFKANMQMKTFIYNRNVRFDFKLSEL